MIRILSLLPIFMLGFISISPVKQADGNLIHSKNDTLFWNEGLKLSRADFFGKEPKRSPYAGYSYTIILMDYEVESFDRRNIKPVFKIRSAFNRAKSWISESSKSNPDRVLMHEQLHFDISELTSRRLKARLEKKRFTENFRREIREIYDSEIAKGEEMQERYDEETRHGLSKERQKAWEIKIQALLEEES